MQGQAQSEGIACTDLQQRDLSVEGRELVQARVDIDPGVTAPRHSHRGEEIVYVIEGTLEYETEGEPPVHSVKNVGASSWNGVIERLQSAGMRVTAPANPLRGSRPTPRTSRATSSRSRGRSSRSATPTVVR
jgi:hypothetical protein